MTRTLLRLPEVSLETGIPEGTLRYWAHKDEGPPSFKLGRRRVYDAEKLAAWIDEQEAASTIKASA